MSDRRPKREERGVDQHFSGFRRPADGHRRCETLTMSTETPAGPRTATADAPSAPSAPAATVDTGRPATPAPARPAPGPPAPPAPSTSGPWAVSLIVLVTGMFMSVLDVSIVNVAIPAMQKDFGATTEDIQWVATSYS